MKEYDAIVHWKEGKAEIKFHELTLPPRTQLKMHTLVSLKPKKPGTIETAKVIIEGYECLDCDYSTESIAQMLWHQKTQHRKPLVRKLRNFLKR